MLNNVVVLLTLLLDVLVIEIAVAENKKYRKHLKGETKMKFLFSLDEKTMLLKNELLLIKGGEHTNPKTCDTGEVNPGCNTNTACPVNNNSGCGCTINNSTTCPK